MIAPPAEAAARAIALEARFAEWRQRHPGPRLSAGALAMILLRLTGHDPVVPRLARRYVPVAVDRRRKAAPPCSEPISAFESPCSTSPLA